MTGRCAGGSRWQDGTGIALGLALGVSLGDLFFDQLATGVALGVVLGVAVDAAQRRRAPGGSGGAPSSS